MVGWSRLHILMRNTFSRTNVRCIIFREKRTWYGVALEFNLVIESKTSREALDELDLAVRDYFHAAKKNHLGTAVLNQVADEEYERMWRSPERIAQPRKHALAVPSNLYSSMILRPALA
jgi:hypothetical protein